MSVLEYLLNGITFSFREPLLCLKRKIIEYWEVMKPNRAERYRGFL